MKWQGIKLNSIIFLLSNACFFLIGLTNFSKISSKSTIISILISQFISYFVLDKFLNKYKDSIITEKKNIFVDFIKIGVIFFLLNFILDKTTSYITYNVVSSLSYYIVEIFFLICSIFLVSKGFSTIVKSSFLYLLTDILVIFITFFLLFTKMNFNNILPVIDADNKSIIISCLIYLIVCFAPFSYLHLFKVKLDKKTIISIKKGFIATHAFIFLCTLVIFSILGVNLVNVYPYPEVAIFKKVSFLNIIDRVESVFSISYFLSLFIFFSINFYELSLIIKRNFKIKKETRFLIFLASLIILSNEIINLSVFYFLLLLLLLITCFLITNKVS